MSAALRIDPRTRHVVDDAIESAIKDDGKSDTVAFNPQAAVNAIMSLEFEVVGVGPNGEQALCAIDPESSVKS